MRTSLSLDSVEEGRGAEIGVYDEKGCGRLGSADPNASGDSISLCARCLSNSRGCGLVRRLFPDDDSDPCSGPICCWGVMAGPSCAGIGCGGVRSWGLASAPRGDGSEGAVMDVLPRLGGG